MPWIRTRLETLIDKKESTYLTAAAAAADTSLTVASTLLAAAATSSLVWANNDYMIVGEIGAEGTEIMQMSAAVTSATSLSIDREGQSGGLRHTHAIGTPIYRIDWDQIRIFHDSSVTTSPSTTITTIQIQPDKFYTAYEDTSQTSGYYYVRFRNSTSAGTSSLSSAIPFAGHVQRSLWEIARRIYRELGFLKNDDMDESQIKFEEVRRAINDKIREVVHDRLWSFAEDERSFSMVANQFRYVPASTAVNKIYTVSYLSEPMIYIDRPTWERFHINSDTTGDPTHFTIWNNELLLYPKRTTAAATTTESGALTATATSVTVAATSGFTIQGGFYRFIIDSEVIYATGSTSTTFTGLLRGREGTTAAAHTDATTITERDIVYTYQVEPEELGDITDETLIPEPEGIAFGVGAELALGVLRDNALADRLQIKYDKWFEKLKNKYSKKVISPFGRVKDIYLDEILYYEGGVRDPNDYPQSLT